jgi:hypothetical protein
MKRIFRKKHYHHGDIPYYDKMGAAHLPNQQEVYYSCGDRCYETGMNPYVLASAKVIVVNFRSCRTAHVRLPYPCFECQEANRGKPIPASALATGSTIAFDACDCTVTMAKWDRAIGWMYKLRGTISGDAIFSRGSEWVPENVIFRRGWT